MGQKQTELDITDKDELILLLGLNQNRRITLGRLAPPGNDGKAYHTLFWADEELRDKYHKSVDAYLFSQDIAVKTFLVEGQKPDVISPKATLRPMMHPMQGDLTPKVLEWLLKWAPIEFENVLGVKKRALQKGETYSEDPRENWRRETVVRNVTQPVPGKKGGEYLSVRFVEEDQLIARRATHLTFTEKEIYREGPRDADGNETQITVEAYDDIYSPDMLEKMEKAGKIRVLWKRPGAASATSAF